jgi:hypothetical protein
MVNLEEAIVAYFKVLSQHFPGEIENNHENFSRILVSRPRFKARTS